MLKTGKSANRNEHQNRKTKSPPPLAYHASFQEHSLKRNCGNSVKSICISPLLPRSTGAQIILLEKKRAKYIERPAHSLKPKFLFKGRKRDGRRSSLLIVDEQMRIELAAVVSFGKMTLLVLTLSLKPGSSRSLIIYLYFCKFFQYEIAYQLFLKRLLLDCRCDIN